MAHLSMRLPDELSERLDVMTQLSGLNGQSDLVRRYILEGLERDSADIEAKIEAKIKEDADRLRALAARMKSALSPEASGDDDEEEAASDA